MLEGRPCEGRIRLWPQSPGSGDHAEYRRPVLLRTEAAGCGLLSVPWAARGLLFAFCTTRKAPSKGLTSVLVHRQPPCQHCGELSLHQYLSFWETGVGGTPGHLLDAEE